MDTVAITHAPVPAWKGYVWPLLLSVIVLGIATIAGFIWRDGGVLTANILEI